MMKAVFYNEYGSPDVLEYGELEKPKINEDEILINAHASSVNPVDWKIRNGSIRLLTGKKFPKGTGRDIAGIITKAGGKVTVFEVGDEVYGKLSGLKSNACAEYVVAKPVDLFRKPVNLNFNEAAAVPLAALTAYQSLVTLGGLKKGLKVLVNGCSGGVGHFGVQIAKALEAEVTGVCSARNIALAIELGADNVIDYTKETVVDKNEKYDIFFDAVANQPYKKIKPLLEKKGRYVTTLPAISVIFNSITGIFRFKKARIISVKSNPRDLKIITEMIENGKLKPIIDKIYPLEDVREAHRYSETGRVVGKLAIAII
ncbi:MAG: NAD(P)-dependent alcohol dehydrogenase [Candidatus Neomarinimicrobiota bacterium]